MRLLILLIVRNSSVDDKFSRDTAEEVTKMRGSMEKLPDGKLKYNVTVPNILELVSMKPKITIMSGKRDEDAKKKLGDKILGHVWEPLVGQLIS